MTTNAFNKHNGNPFRSIATATAISVCAFGFAGATSGPAFGAPNLVVAASATSNSFTVTRLSDGDYQVKLDLADNQKGRTVLIKGTTFASGSRVTSVLGRAKVGAKGKASLTVSRPILVGTSLIVSRGSKVLIQRRVTSVFDLTPSTPVPSNSPAPNFPPISSAPAPAQNNDGGGLSNELNPQFGTPVATDGGYTTEITNFDGAFEWVATSTSGTVSIDGVGLVVVSGLTVGESATVVVLTTRTGYGQGEAEITSSSLNAARSPMFGAAVRTSDGFTVEIENYDVAFEWNATSDNGQATIDGAGLVTVTNLAPETSATVQVSTTREGYFQGGSSFEAASLAAALVPLLGDPIRTPDGFVVEITNFDGAFDWTASTTGLASASIDVVTGLLTLTGIDLGSEATVIVTAERAGSNSGESTVTARALNAELTPMFDATTSTSDGFTVQITNFDGDFMWLADVTAGGFATISGTGLLTVTGLAPDTQATVTVTTLRQGYVLGQASTSASSIRP